MDLVSDTPALCMKVIGTGGAGNNIVERLHPLLERCFSFAQIDTDQRTLALCTTPEKQVIGQKKLHGIGAGGDSVTAREVAEDDQERLQQCIEGVDLLCIIAGLGGGNGSGISPVLASLAETTGALVIAIVTLPFSFEGARRRQQADSSLVELRRYCHAVIPLPNDMVMQQLDEQASVLDAFSKVDAWIQGALQSLSNMLLRPGLFEVDLTSLHNLFQCRGGKTLYGLGEGRGESAAEQALHELFLCPLLYLPELSQSAEALIVHIEGGPDLQITQVNSMMSTITKRFTSGECNLLSATIHQDYGDKLRVFVLGISESERQKGYLLPRKTTVARHQHELSLEDRTANRGTFKITSSNLYQGEDLDIPTFLRRGIKIQDDLTPC